VADFALHVEGEGGEIGRDREVHAHERVRELLVVHMRERRGLA